TGSSSWGGAAALHHNVLRKIRRYGNIAHDTKLGKISAGSRWVAAFPCHSVAYYVNLVRSAGLAGPGRAKCPQSLATVSPSRGRPNGSASRTQPSNTTSRRAFLQSTC